MSFVFFACSLSNPRLHTTTEVFCWPPGSGQQSLAVEMFLCGFGLYIPNAWTVHPRSQAHRKGMGCAPCIQVMALRSWPLQLTQRKPLLSWCSQTFRCSQVTGTRWGEQGFTAQRPKPCLGKARQGPSLGWKTDILIFSSHLPKQDWSVCQPVVYTR